METDHALDSLFGRIFYGKPVSTFPENALGRLGVRHMAHVVVVAHGTRLLTVALYADGYLVVQIKSTIG